MMQRGSETEHKMFSDRTHPAQIYTSDVDKAHRFTLHAVFRFGKLAPTDM